MPLGDAPAGDAVQAALRLAKHLGAGPERAPGARWAHLPGGGRGLVQPGARTRTRVRLVALAQPLVVFGVLGLGVLGCWKMFPGLLGGIGHSATPAVVHSTPAPAVRR